MNEWDSDDDWPDETVEVEEELTPEDIVASLSSMKSNAELKDFAPLLVVLNWVAILIRYEKIELESERGKSLWIEAVKLIQSGYLSIENNSLLPCWKCTTAFQPEVDQRLFELFLNWCDSNSSDKGVQIHLCKDCGGTIPYSYTEEYEDDMDRDCAETWMYQLLQDHDV